MKHIAPMTLMLTLGVAAVYAHERPVTMTFSGNGAASPINLKQPNTNTAEENVAGNGTLGRFTFRNVTAIAASRRGHISLPRWESIEGHSHPRR